MSNTTYPLQVGIIGTGFAACRRAEAFLQYPQVSLIGVTGNSRAKTLEFSEKYGVSVVNSWQELVTLPNINLVVICTVNSLHGLIAKEALKAGKNVIIEYPLSLDILEAEELINLAKEKNLLLHVEHIEILGGLHHAIKEYLPKIGKVFYARYITVKIDRPAVQKWTYNHELYGFPLKAAVSRIHRFTDLFGEVSSVSGNSKFWDIPNTPYYSACLCQGKLQFTNGVIGEIVYGKGDKFWQSYRDFEIHGEAGTLIFQGDKGHLINSEGKQEIIIPSRRGLFQKDTEIVLNNLLTNNELYVSNTASYYALKIADFVEKAGKTGTVLSI